jgi:hypothetical protein
MSVITLNQMLHNCIFMVGLALRQMHEVTFVTNIGMVMGALCVHSSFMSPILWGLFAMHT